MTSRFFVPSEQIQHCKFTLLGSEAHHAARVLRKKVGDTIELFDGKDASYQGSIESISPERVEGRILQAVTARRTIRTRVVLYAAMIKGPRWDWLVEKACEVGAARLVPVLTTRTIIKPSRESGLERWNRIALAASKQSGRAQVMDVVAPLKFIDAVAALRPDGLAFIPSEKESTMTIRHKFRDSPEVSVFIGPEGGWEISEVDFARRHGVIPVTIAATLLRSETAALVALAQVLSEIGDA